MAPDAEGCGVKKGGVVLNILDFLNQNYPVRRTEKEKDSFRAEIIRRLAEKGVDARVESTGDGKNKNIVIGDVASAKVVCTAHYDTPAAALFPNIMIPRNSLLFYLYQEQNRQKQNENRNDCRYYERNETAVKQIRKQFDRN